MKNTNKSAVSLLCVLYVSFLLVSSFALGFVKCMYIGILSHEYTISLLSYERYIGNAYLIGQKIENAVTQIYTCIYLSSPFLYSSTIHTQHQLKHTTQIFITINALKAYFSDIHVYVIEISLDFSV